jgi:hypothetical protein
MNKERRRHRKIDDRGHSHQNGSRNRARDHPCYPCGKRADQMMSSRLTGIGVGLMNRPVITELATFQCLLTK